VKSIRHGLLLVVLVSAGTWAQPQDKLAAVYRAGNAMGAASRANLTMPDARNRFRRAVSALGREIKVAHGMVRASAEKDILHAYSLAQRKLEKAASSLELWATLEEEAIQADALAGAVPATRGGVEAKTEILNGLQSRRQQAASEGKLALANANAALREGLGKLAEAERAYLTGRPDARDETKSAGE
jgi:hypothetical protein